MRPWIGRLVALLAVLFACSYVVSASPALAQPELSEADPWQGASLDAAPEVLHLCFTEPVKVEQSSDWAFSVKPPDGTALGLRIVFQPSGDCVDVYPGTVPGDAAKGIWTFDWLVHSQASGDEGSGVIEFQVGGDFGLTPAPTREAPATQAPVDSTAGSGDGGGGDTLTIVLVVIALVIAAASLGLLAYARLARRRGAPPGGGRPGRG